MERIFQCPETGEPCTDGRCLKDHCVAVQEAAAYQRVIEARLNPPIDLDVRRTKKKIAVSILKMRGMTPSDALVTKAMRNPRVEAEAERQVAWSRSTLATILADPKLDDLF